MNPVVPSFSEDDELEAVMGCASVPRKGTVTPEELLSFFDWLVETGEVSVGNNLQFSDEFVSSVNSTVLCCFFFLMNFFFFILVLSQNKLRLDTC